MCGHRSTAAAGANADASGGRRGHRARSPGRRRAADPRTRTRHPPDQPPTETPHIDSRSETCRDAATRHLRHTHPPPLRPVSRFSRPLPRRRHHHPCQPPKNHRRQHYRRSVTSPTRSTPPSATSQPPIPLNHPRRHAPATAATPNPKNLSHRPSPDPHAESPVQTFPVSAPPAGQTRPRRRADRRRLHTSTLAAWLDDGAGETAPSDASA